MNAQRFINKWKNVALTERSSAHEHFLDLCELVGHPRPAEADVTGESFTFEKGAAKMDGGKGWADVWKRGFFAWEYKGRGRDLTAAYRQLQQYRDALENPPLLVVCDTDRVIIHTNFTNTPVLKYELTLANLSSSVNLDILRAVFHDPEKLRPGLIREVITTSAAAEIAAIAQALRDRRFDPHRVARFMDRLVFCMFAEDVGLLSEKSFMQILERSRKEPDAFNELVGRLFKAMAEGDYFGADRIPHFNGNLFSDAEALPLTEGEIEQIRRAALLDWGAVDPSIFGTLFERGLDPDKRSQIGAHYTSREDIDTLVEPVVMQPLRREWDHVREQVEAALASPRKTASDKKNASHQADKLVYDYLQRLARIKVLDPACGSGNFLYVTLQKLKDLEKDVIEYTLSRGLAGHFPQVGPEQLYGIEISPYAHDLAQMTVWIGYLQWMHDHGSPLRNEPILGPAENFKCMDAIIDLSDPANPKEPEWPEVDFIVGNPPFLGGNKVRSELEGWYVDALFALYAGRVPAFSDLCCYWFEKARRQIEKGKCRRAGLLATQGIRGGANRETLKRIKETGDIFFAESDRPWVLDGANVHVSMVGFDDGTQQACNRHKSESSEAG